MIKPWQCKVFGGACTPETPLGALMVSSEGACAAYYNYGGAHLAEKAPRRESRGGRVTSLRAARRVRDTRITLAHGSGGKAMHDLIEDVFVATFDDAALDPLEDQARLPLAELMAHDDRLAFTTDSYVVDPLFFARGDIGRLAVAGTVNDLAVGGAKPLYLSCASISEEGLDIALLRRVARSMQDAAAEAGVKLVTGDTKVVPRGAADKLFINTAGIGVIPEGLSIAADRAQPGDVILVNGTIGSHGSSFCRSGRISASQPRSPAIASR